MIKLEVGKVYETEESLRWLIVEKIANCYKCLSLSSPVLITYIDNKNQMLTNSFFVRISSDQSRKVILNDS